MNTKWIMVMAGGPMKLCGRLCLAVIIVAIAGISLRTTAQDWQGKHHHYVLMDVGTFGGPRTYINGNDFLSPYNQPAQVVNDAGTLVGWADTSTPDPYAPNFCFVGGCYVANAFAWHNGFKINLGTLPGGLSSATSWISANGLIAGASQNDELDPLVPGAPENRAVLWKEGNVIDLKTLEGGYESGAESVNSRGQVVGWAFNTVPDPYSMGSWSPVFNNYEPFPYPYQNRAFLWQNGVMQDLGTLGTGTDAFAVQINEQGQVIGFSYTSSTPNPLITGCSSGGAAGGAMLPPQDPFLWENNKMTDLGTLGGICGFPQWINNRGEVVGVSDLAGDVHTHPFLWTKDAGMRDLGTLGGGSAYAQLINDSGKVVGGAVLTGDTQTDAFLWDGTMHDLGTLGGGFSYAFWINENDQVVGNWGNNSGQGGFLWENGGPMVDLNTLVSSNSGLSVGGAIEINDRGDIVGAGIDANGNVHAVILLPCDENHPAIEGCDYSLADPASVAEVRPSLAARMPATANSIRGSFMGLQALRRVRVRRNGFAGIEPANH